MNQNIATVVFNQLNEHDKESVSREVCDTIVFLYNELASDYEVNVFDKVHHVDLFFQKGFDSYIDAPTVCQHLVNELRKDAISLDEEFVLKIVYIIRTINK